MGFALRKRDNRAAPTYSRMNTRSEEPLAERLMLVCDVCGAAAVETVTFKTSGANRQKDYCVIHLQELLSGSRVPKRGRKPNSAAATSRRKSTTASGRRAKRSGSRKKVTARTGTGAGYSKNGKRLGRPPGSRRKQPVARKASTKALKEAARTPRPRAAT
jgi:hypothetical protein